jgi:hypothetical protein
MTLFDSPSILKNGQEVKVGTLVKCTYYIYTSFCRVSEIDGMLSVYAPAPFMFVTSIDHFQSQGGEVEVFSPVEVYKWCKKRGDNFSYYANKGLFNVTQL